jgi:hypothetical protein
MHQLAAEFRSWVNNHSLANAIFHGIAFRTALIKDTLRLSAAFLS